MPGCACSSPDSTQALTHLLALHPESDRPALPACKPYLPPCPAVGLLSRLVLLLSQLTALPMPVCRPYLLPCLAVGLLSLVATCSSIFLLSETLPRLTSKQYMTLHSADEEAPKVEGGLQSDGLEGAGEGPALVWNALHGGSAAQIDHLMGLIRRLQIVMHTADPSLNTVSAMVLGHPATSRPEDMDVEVCMLSVKV